MQAVWESKRLKQPPPYGFNDYKIGEVHCYQDRGTSIWKRKLVFPMGMLLVKDLLYVCTDNYITVLNARTGEDVDEIHHPLFNDLHSIHSVGDNFIIASSGSDRILIVNRNGYLLWEWSAIENGFPLNTKGEKKTDYTVWNDKKIPTFKQTTHVNYACMGNHGILASLFHQGYIIEIQPDGNYDILHRNLTRPHSIQELEPNVFICANSNAKEILIFGRNKVFHRFIGKGWIQNLECTREGFYFIDADWGTLGFVCKSGYEKNKSLLNNVIHTFDENLRLFDIKVYD